MRRGFWDSGLEHLGAGRGEKRHFALDTTHVMSFCAKLVLPILHSGIGVRFCTLENRRPAWSRAAGFACTSFGVRGLGAEV